MTWDNNEGLTVADWIISAIINPNRFQVVHVLNGNQQTRIGLITAHEFWGLRFSDLKYSINECETVFAYMELRF